MRSHFDRPRVVPSEIRRSLVQLQQRKLVFTLQARPSQRQPAPLAIVPPVSPALALARIEARHWPSLEARQHVRARTASDCAVRAAVDVHAVDEPVATWRRRRSGLRAHRRGAHTSTQTKQQTNQQTKQQTNQQPKHSAHDRVPRSLPGAGGQRQGLRGAQPLTACAAKYTVVVANTTRRATRVKVKYGRVTVAKIYFQPLFQARAPPQPSRPCQENGVKALPYPRGRAWMPRPPARQLGFCRSLRRA